LEFDDNDGQLELFPWATKSQIDQLLKRLEVIERETSRHWEELYWLIHRTNLAREQPISPAKMFASYRRRCRRYGIGKGGRKAPNEATRP